MRPVRGKEFCSCGIDGLRHRRPRRTKFRREGTLSTSISGFGSHGDWIENVGGSFDVVGDGSQSDLERGFGRSSPSHSPKSVTAFPGAEDLFDPTANPLNTPVPMPKLAETVVARTAPHAGEDNMGNTSLCFNSGRKRLPPVAAVSINHARLVR